MSSSVRNFLVVFLLALLGFGILGHFISTDLVPSIILSNESDSAEYEQSNQASDDNSDYTSEGSSDVVMEGNKFNFAFICTDINNKLAGVYLIHTDDGYKTCVNVSIPGNASVESQGAYTTLAEFYETKGEKAFLIKLFYLTGCKIDEYVTLSAVDISGNGSTITQLSTYLGYTYKINEGFDYPATDYDGDTSDEASRHFVSQNIRINAGSYALNGETDGVKNDKILLDTKFNVNAFDIYSSLLTRIINDTSFVGNTSKQAKVMGYMLNKSFGGYASSDAAVYLFNDFIKASLEYSGTSGAWDDIRESVKSLERKI